MTTALNISDIPQCARTCISQATTAQAECSVIDIACLCSDSKYVAALSCCLATQCTTSEQAVAIQFNQEECGSVNRTAPLFVGCSPGSLNSTSGGSTAPANTLASTVTQPVVSEPFSYTNTIPITATFSGRALLTSSCTVPYFAIVTNPAGGMTEFPFVGCGANRPGCCLYNDGQDAVVTQCPQDYFPTAGGCCPTGYQVYGDVLGQDVPCYSLPTQPLVPATTPTTSNLVLITDHVFTKKYNLATPSTPSRLSLGGLIGIIINAVFVVVVVVGVTWFIRRRRRLNKITQVSKGETFPPEEPVLPTREGQKTHELDTPISGPAGSGSPQVRWSFLSPPSSPPAYDATKGRPVSLRTAIAQELPGSTWMNEHHPAFRTDSSADGTLSKSELLPPKSKPEERQPEPSTPPASVARSDSPSPFVSPCSVQEKSQPSVVAWPLKEHGTPEDDKVVRKPKREGGVF